jgi:branched-chain amino acid transport system ATP-binding protein
LVKVRKGEIFFTGTRIDGLPSYEIIKQGIAVCPEGGGCFAEMTVYKNLLMGALFIKDQAVVEEGFKKVAELFPVLEKRRNQKAGTLSGGERQMLAIGRALMGNPKLLLLDEPSLGLAPIVINDIYQAIERLRHRGLSILLIEQNASKSLKLADRGYVLELGKIVLTGSGEELGRNEQVKKAYFGI